MPQIKLFAWQTSKNGLSCYSNLRRKNVDVESHCPFYKAAREDIVHALFYCLDIKACWPRYLPCLREINQPLRLVVWVKSKDQVELLSNFFVIAWCIWRRINKLIYEKATLPPQSTFDWALSYQALFSDCCKTKGLELLSKGCCQPPDPGFLKLNIDGALFIDMQAVDFEAILRDNNGDALLVTSIKETDFYFQKP